MKLLITIFLATAALTSAKAQAFEHPKKGDLTLNPVLYAVAHTEFPEGGFEQYQCDACQSLKQAMFIAPTKTCGTGACEFMIFEKQNDRFAYVTSIAMKPHAIEFLKTSHNGYPDIKTYIHQSAEDGLITQQKFDGTNYVALVNDKRIKSKDLAANIKPDAMHEITDLKTKSEKH